MDKPTADLIRSISRVPFDSVGMGAADPDLLQEALDSIIPWVEDVTGYFYTGDGEPEIPARYEAPFRKAVRMAAEWEAFKMLPDSIEGIVDLQEVLTTSAGSFSETRRSAIEMRQIDDNQLHPWPDLDRALRALLSPDKQPNHEPMTISGPCCRDRPGVYLRPVFYDPFDMRPGGWCRSYPFPWVNPIGDLP